ncbi:MAG: NAD(P)H-dependent oxidoreductase [Pseudomonadota bacterium]
MAKLLVIYAHPGQRFSRANSAMADVAKAVDGITFVDLYAEYPRHDIHVHKEQERLVEHDVILFQFPFYWYSTPSLIKEWQDLVLQHGFAYGSKGMALAGKTMMLALTAGGPIDAYSTGGHNNHEIRDFLTPLQQTATLCKMSFSDPYVLFASLAAEAEEKITAHAAGYAQILAAIRDDAYDLSDKGGFVVADQVAARIKG